MTREEAKAILERYNTWRRDDHIPNAYEMPNPKDIGVAIDVAISSLDALIDLTHKYAALKERWKEKEKGLD